MNFFALLLESGFERCLVSPTWVKAYFFCCVYATLNPFHAGRMVEIAAHAGPVVVHAALEEGGGIEMLNAKSKNSQSRAT